MVRHAGPMHGPLRVTTSVSIPAEELTWRFSRSRGPGGQGVNTTDSRVELSWDLEASSALSPPLKQRAARRLGSRLTSGVLTIAASEYRSQLRNRQAARDRLAVLVREAIAPPAPARRATRPTLAARRRRMEDKRRRGDLKRLRRADPD
jgi:ribosome-associated protein